MFCFQQWRSELEIEDEGISELCQLSKLNLSGPNWEQQLNTKTKNWIENVLAMARNNLERWWFFEAAANVCFPKKQLKFQLTFITFTSILNM